MDETKVHTNYQSNGVKKRKLFTIEDINDVVNPVDITDEFVFINKPVVPLQKALEEQKVFKLNSESNEKIAEDIEVVNRIYQYLNPPFSLMPHQIEAIKWLQMREKHEHHGIHGGIIAAEMGLGKSLMVIYTSAIGHTPGDMPTLYICNKSLVGNFINDIKKFYGDRLPYIMYAKCNYKNPKDFENLDLSRCLGTFILIITTYETVKGIFKNKHSLAYKNMYEVIKWKRVVADESHKFANPKTEMFKSLQALPKGLRVCLSGTVVNNYEKDIFTQLRFCGLHDFVVPHTQSTYDMFNLVRCVYRITKADCDIKLPEKTDQIIKIDFETEDEKQLYNEFLAMTRNTINSYEQKTAQYMTVLQQLIKLRQTCAVPNIVLLTEDADKKYPGITMKFPWLLNPLSQGGVNCTKIKVAMKIIREVPASDKIIVFTEWVSVVDVIIMALNMFMPELRAIKVDGQTKNRDELFNRFRTDPSCRVLVMTRVGSLGLNLSEANHVILYESDWTDVHELQSVGRCWRIGQKKPVFAWRLMIKGSIEEKMYVKCQEKSAIRECLLNNPDKIPVDLVKEFLGDME
jgi:SNF2 family DNA or RNA helicase